NSKITFTRYIPVAPAEVPKCIVYNYPPNGSSNQCTNTTLSWSAVDGYPTGYDVYFGTNQTLVSNADASVRVSTNQAVDYYTPAITQSSTYYWKVVPINSVGTAIAANMPTWSFTTSLGDRTPIEITSDVGTLVSRTYWYTDAYGRDIYTNTYDICQSMIGGTLSAQDFNLSDGSQLNWTNPVYFFGIPLDTCTNAIPTNLWSSCSGGTQS